MDETDEHVRKMVAAFEKEQDPTLLYQALEVIEAAEKDLSPEDRTARKQAVSRWMRFFAALDQYIDPAWDPDDKPVQGVPPPSSHSGAVYPSGEVDPASIADPAERAEYEEALKANKALRKWYDVQFQLRRIDERALGFFELFLNERYTDAPADQQELEDLLNASQVDEARQNQLLALIKKQ